jgi:hypothetical protein
VEKLTDRTKAMTEQEEFEFRLRFESEQATAAPAGPTPAPSPSMGALIAEGARKGFAGTVGAVSGLANVIDRAGINPFTMGMRAAGTPIPAPTGGLVETFQQGREPVYGGLMRLMGSTGVQPQTGPEKMISQGAEAVTSPESYVFPALSVIKRLGPVAQTLLRPTEQAIVGGSAEAGGQAGEYAGEKVGAPGTGRFLGSLFGGIGGAYTTGAAIKTGELTGKGISLATSQWNKIRGTNPEDELLKDVDNRISNIFIAAGAADPNFMKVLTEAAKAQESVYLKAPGGTPVQMPLSSLLADNPVINNFIQSLSSKDPVFRAQYSDQFEKAKQAMVANQIKLFGDPSKVQVSIKPTDLAAPQARRLRTIDEQIADVYSDKSMDPTMLGNRIDNLLAKKEDAAYKEVRPLYTEAFNIAKDKNVELPSTAVDDIFNSVAGAQASDIFKTFPSIYNRVRAKFKPETVEPSAILTAEGKPAIEGGVKFSAATVEDLDSLKREINKQLRKTSDPADIRLLTELKTRVSGHIDNLDPDFVTAYRNADNSYLQKVGLPFNSDTLNNIDRKKFVEQIAPALIGNKSNVSQFIDATGQDGVRVARDAFMDSFSRAVLKDDVINPKLADKWLKKNQGGVSLIPGLENELRGSVTNVQVLLAERKRLDDAFREVAGNQIIKGEGFNNAQDLVTKMYGDVNFTNKFMSKSGYGENKDAVNAVRSFMLDDIVKSGDPIGLLNDRSKSAVFNRVFGPTYAQKVADFATVSNRITKDLTNVPFRTETVAKTPVEMLTGIPPEQIISRIYNPVSGVTYAITSLASKFWANQASKMTEQRIKELLLNPADAVKVFNAVQPKINQFDRTKLDEAIAVGKKYGINWVADAANDAMSGAARGAVQGIPQPQE